MFEMFTDAGNDAVGEIVRWGILASEDRDTAYTKIHAELELLGQVGVFGEATDTAVREAVWAEICSSLTRMGIQKPQSINWLTTLYSCAIVYE
jgi:hypothetical protein